MRMQRLIDLVCVLADRDSMTIQELADHFKVSKRTIFRDLSTLNHMGIPVVSCQGAVEGDSAVKEYKIDKSLVPKDDTRNIVTLLNELGMDGGKMTVKGNQKKPDDIKDKDYCPCRKACHYHGSCKECVAMHRAHQENVPNCMRSLVDGKIKHPLKATGHTIAHKIRDSQGKPGKKQD